MTRRAVVIAGIASLLALLVTTTSLVATVPMVTVTYHVMLPSGGYPAALTATAAVTWMSVADPALIDHPVTAAYDPTTGTASWSLPANSQVLFRCSATGLNATYSVGSQNVVLNSLIPVTAPAVAPAWAAALASYPTPAATDWWHFNLSAAPMPGPLPRRQTLAINLANPNRCHRSVTLRHSNSYYSCTLQALQFSLFMHALSQKART